MRGTIHLVTADDCLLLRPLVQPVLDRELANHRDHAPRLVAVDLDAVKAAGREILAERPLNGAEFRTALEQRFPGDDGAALGLRLPQSSRPDPDTAAWPVAAQRRDPTLHCRGMARSARPGRPEHRRGRASLPCRVRPGEQRRHRRLVPAHRHPRGHRPAPAAAPLLPRRARPGAARPSRRVSTPSRHARSSPVPPRVRQRRAVPRRPQPVCSRGRPRARRCAAAGEGFAARRRRPLRHLANRDRPYGRLRRG